MPTSATDKLALAEMAVKRAKAEGVTPQRVIEDADLDEALVFAEAEKAKRSDLFNRADAAERAKRESAKLALDEMRVDVESDPVAARLRTGFAQRGVTDWGEVVRLSELAASGVVKLSPDLHADAVKFADYARQWEENGKRGTQIRRAEPERADELRGAAYASMADPTFGGMPTE